MKYKINRIDKADEQLREFIFYIADDSGSIEIALNYLDKIESAINQLEEFPIYVAYSVLIKAMYYCQFQATFGFRL